MSQLQKPGGGGGSGAVSSVEGIAPIEVNGVSGVPQTGAVVVSLLGSFVINTPVVTGVDYTMVQQIPLYTPTSDFILNAINLIFDTVVADLLPGTFSIGFNAPNFDNIVPSTNVPALTGSGIFLNITPPGIYYPVVPTGQTIVFNMTIGETATICTGRIFLTGSLI